MFDAGAAPTMAYSAPDMANRPLSVALSGRLAIIPQSGLCMDEYIGG